MTTMTTDPDVTFRRNSEQNEADRSSSQATGGIFYVPNSQRARSFRERFEHQEITEPDSLCDRFGGLQLEIDNSRRGEVTVRVLTTEKVKRFMVCENDDVGSSKTDSYAIHNELDPVIVLTARTGQYILLEPRVIANKWTGHYEQGSLRFYPKPENAETGDNNSIDLTGATAPADHR